MKQQVCHICHRVLNNPGDELSQDCGGDCWGCVGEIEADGYDLDSVPKVLDEWRRGLRPNWKPTSEMLDGSYKEC